MVNFVVGVDLNVRCNAVNWGERILFQKILSNRGYEASVGVVGRFA